jgi:hypothetical protein
MIALSRNAKARPADGAAGPVLTAYACGAAPTERLFPPSCAFVASGRWSGSMCSHCLEKV